MLPWVEVAQKAQKVALLRHLLLPRRREAPGGNHQVQTQVQKPRQVAGPIHRGHHLRLQGVVLEAVPCHQNRGS